MITEVYTCCAWGVDPYENIALEKYLLDRTPKDAVTLYLWQNENTVVIGKNQNAWSECRTGLLEAEGGKLARRLSGGGAVFHDLGNLNFTFLCHDENYDLDRQFQVIIEACRMAGIPVERSGRNDLLALGRKFSGNAFYHSQGRSYHHGTLLVAADMDKLSRYLSPPKAKLEAKGVSSVRSRVCNLRDLASGLTISLLTEFMQRAFAQVYGLSPLPFPIDAHAQTQIKGSAGDFSDWEYLFGPRLPLSFSCSRYFPWGTVQLELAVEKGTVSQVRVYTDAMDWLLPDAVKTALEGCRLRMEDMEKALQDALSPEIARDLIALLRDQEL